MCGKTLTPAPEHISHVNVMSTGKYKKYLWDSTSPVPRATLWRHRKYKTPKESTSGIANTKCLDPGLGPCDSSLLKREGREYKLM